MKDQRRTINGMSYISRKKVYTNKTQAQKYANWHRRTGSRTRVIEIKPNKWRVFIAELYMY